VAVDQDWKVVYVNAAAESLLHVRLHKAVGESLLRHLPPEPPELEAALRGTMEDGRPRRLQGVRPGVEGLRGRYFDLSVDPLAGGGISLLFQDVTERQQREAELARLAAEAEEASRAKSRFFAAVSHELRTPLHAIVGYTHLLSTDSYGEMPQPASRAAERASVCAEHLARLIDDVLVLTTTDVDRLPLYPAPLRLAEYLDEVLEPFRRQAEAKGLRFELEAPPALALRIDPERLRQVVYALVANAIKFTSRGFVRVAVRADEDTAEVRVEDSGPGIAAGDRARIFEAFEQVGDDDARTDSIHRGTGLGLTIARKLAARLGGSLALDGDRDGGGSAFVLRVPITAAD